jgi:thiol-disulfide isomerase/thioredoxin
MNKKVLWISVASVATLGIAGFFIWRGAKKRKARKAEELAQAQATEDIEYKEVDGGEAESPEPQPQTPPPYVEIEENLVYLSATWCPACKQNAEVAEKLYAKYKDKIEFIKLDADEEIARSYGTQLELRHIPTLAFVSDGEKIDEMVGPKSLAEYEAKIAEYFPDLFPKKAKMQAPTRRHVQATAQPQVAPPQPQPEAQQEQPKTTADPVASEQAPSENGTANNQNVEVEQTIEGDA